MPEYIKKVCMDPMFLRNQFFSVGKYDIPLFRKQSVPVENLEIIGYQNAKCDDPHASKRIVHGFKDDDRCINSVFKIEKRNTVVPIIGAKRIVQKGQNVMDSLKFYKSMLRPGDEHWGNRDLPFDGVREVSIEDAINMLEAYREHRLSYEELLDWANLILFNDSFDFRGEVLRDCLDRIEESDESDKELDADDTNTLIQALSKHNQNGD